MINNTKEGVEMIDEILERNICDYYLSHKKITTTEISKKFNISPNFIKIILMHNGINPYFYKSKKPRNNIKQDFFSNIETEKQAYWLGFILADGYLDNQGSLGVELEEKDYSHLIKFKEDLEIKNDIHIYNKNSTFGEQINCRITVTNYYILYDLWYKWNIDLDKSNTGEMPKIDNKNLYKHLIRGYFDGNGSLTIKKNKSTSETVCKNIGICGTKQILSFIEEISGFDWHWSKRRDNNTNNFQIGVGRRDDCYNFLEWMYKDSKVYLDRKYEKFKNIIK